MNPNRSCFVCALLLSLAVVTTATAVEPSMLPSVPAKDRWIDPDGISGSLVIAGGGSLPDEVFEAFKRLAGEAPKLVVIPTASQKADASDADAKTKELWQGRGFEDVTVLHTRDRETANTDDFAKPLTEATAVWFGGGQQSRLAETYGGTKVESALSALLKRGGVIGGSSAGAAIQSELMIAGGNPEAKMRRGLPFLPDAIIDQHFSERNRSPRLVGALAAHPGRFGIGIDERTAVVVRGRRIRVLGAGKATLALPAGGGRDAVQRELNTGGYADLTSLRRAAKDRQNGIFPPATPQQPKVKAGSLMIVGGGGMPRELVERFIKLAGGPEAKIVIAPTALGDPLPPDSRFTSMFTRMGAKNVVVLRQRKREDVESEEFREALKGAGGVWFGGGRQWRFMDAYEGTQAEALFQDVLKRGGIIGGSSAGASIQAEYMVRGNPLGNTDMMAWGYERGLNFIPGVAIDQHFTQRRRHKDLQGVIERHPQLLGIGIDETTAIIVQGDVAEVAGKHDTYFLTVRDGQLTKVGVPSGGKFNLVTKKVIEAKPVEAGAKN